MEKTWAILVAGGTGTRFASRLPKQFLPLAGRRVLEYSLDVVSGSGIFSGVVLVLPKNFVKEWKKELSQGPYSSVRVTAGGVTRQDSVLQGLKMVEGDAQWILIHDVARPLVSKELLENTLLGARETGAAVTAVPVSDTLKKADPNLLVEATVSRDSLHQIQTPQVFAKDLLEKALAWAGELGINATDEAGLVEKLGHRVKLVPGSPLNFKITRMEELQMAEAYLTKQGKNSPRPQTRIGQGYDVHPWVTGRKLILGGVTIPFEKGLQGHSDADALSHAIGDALLGAAALGDLGAHFPDTDPQWKNISSLKLLEKILDLVHNAGFLINNVDATLICQKPKLAPHIPAMRENLAKTLGLDPGQVSVKATTEEGLGFTGRMEGLAAQAVVILEKSGSVNQGGGQ